MASSPNPYVAPTVQAAAGREPVKEVVITELSRNSMCLLGAVCGGTAAFVGVVCLVVMYATQFGYLLLYGNLNDRDWGEGLVFGLLMVLIGSLGSTFLFAGIGLIAYYPHRLVLRWTGGLNAKARC